MLNYTQVLNDFVEDFYKNRKDIRHQSWIKRIEELTEDVVNMTFTLLKPKHYLLQALQDEDINLIKALTDLENAFYCFMPFALNLWREPKKEEFHFLKTYTGYFTGNIASVLKGSERHILDLLGYEVKANSENDDEYVINSPKPSQHLTQVAFELFLSQPYYQKVKRLCLDAIKSDFSPEMIVELLLERDTNEVFKIGVKEMCFEKMKKMTEMKLEKEMPKTDANLIRFESSEYPVVENNNLMLSSLNEKYDSLTGRSRLVADADHIDDDLLYGDGTETNEQPLVISDLSQMKLSSSPQLREMRLPPVYPPPYSGPHIYNQNSTTSQQFCSETSSNIYSTISDDTSDYRSNHYEFMDPTNPYFGRTDNISSNRINVYEDITSTSDYVSIDTQFNKSTKNSIPESTLSSTKTTQNHKVLSDTSQSYMDSSKSYINKAYNLRSGSNNTKEPLQRENELYGKLNH